MNHLRLFFPPYFVFKRQNNEIRPFISFNNKINGPGIRLNRLVKEFGNYYYNPNIIYAQSAWNIYNLRETINKSLKANIPIIFNQNGWYYPAWYKGDWKKANQHLIYAHRNSELSIFQSNFCLESMKELTNETPKNYKVIHNCVPYLADTYIKRNLSRAVLWLSGVFNEDADHILNPVLKAVEILSHELKEYSPKLKIAGYFTEGAKKSIWFRSLNERMNYLMEQGSCLWIGRYQLKNLKELMSDVSIALHLTHKDSCPNAVLERMSLSIGHVFSNSGGTPELIGDSGVGLQVKKDWSSQTPVNIDELIECIKLGLDNKDSLGKKAFTRIKNNFKFDEYIRAHKNIFKNSLKK